MVLLSENELKWREITVNRSPINWNIIHYSRVCLQKCFCKSVNRSRQPCQNKQIEHHPISLTLYANCCSCLLHLIIARYFRLMIYPELRVPLSSWLSSSIFSKLSHGIGLSCYVYKGIVPHHVVCLVCSSCLNKVLPHCWELSKCDPITCSRLTLLRNY